MRGHLVVDMGNEGGIVHGRVAIHCHHVWLGHHGVTCSVTFIVAICIFLFLPLLPWFVRIRRMISQIFSYMNMSDFQILDD